MADVVVTIKIMPEGVDANLNNISTESIKRMK